MAPSPRRIQARNHRAGDVVRSLWEGIEAFGFWTAVLLPLAYPAVLLSGGGLSGSWMALVGVLAAHGLALVIGREHGRRESED